MKAIYHAMDDAIQAARVSAASIAKYGSTANDPAADSRRYDMLRRLDRLVDALDAAERFRTKHKVQETVPTLDQYDTVLDDIHSLLKEGLL